MNSNTLEIDLNPQLAGVLNYYGIKTSIANGFISTDRPGRQSFEPLLVLSPTGKVSITNRIVSCENFLNLVKCHL